MIGKTEEAVDYLRRNDIYREYLCLVHGVITEKGKVDALAVVDIPVQAVLVPLYRYTGTIVPAQR